VDKRQTLAYNPLALSFVARSMGYQASHGTIKENAFRIVSREL
jgi:hypothetical protein